jgi:hypothetical protein
MTEKLYTVAAVDEKIDQAFVYLRTLDISKAQLLNDYLHSTSEDYKDVQIIEEDLDEPVYLIDVKFKHSSDIMRNVVEVGEPESDEALKDAIVFSKIKIV